MQNNNDKQRKRRRSISDQEDVARQIIEHFGCRYLGYERIGSRKKIHFIYQCKEPSHHNKPITLSNLERAFEILDASRGEGGALLPFDGSVTGLCKRCIAKHHPANQLQYEIAELKNYAQARHKGECLSERYLGTKHSYQWSCSNPLHEPFDASWDAVTNSGQWCPLCWDERRGKALRMPISDVQAVLDEWGGEIIKNWYEDGRLMLTVRCPNLHEYIVAGTTVKRGHGCEICQHKGERVVRAFLEHNLGIDLPSSRPSWLQKETTKGGRLQLDGYSESNKIAFEYQGPRHQHPSQIKRDQYKAERCEKHGVKLITIQYREKVFPLKDWIPTLEKVLTDNDLDSRFGEVRVPENAIFFAEYKSLQELAESVGWTLLTPNYLGESVPHKWKCSVPEHPPFPMEPSRFRKGVRCSKCMNVSKYNRAEIINIANQLSLSFNSEYWGGSKVPHLWSCEKGHWFQATLSNLNQSQRKCGSACPFCGGFACKTLFTGDAKALISMRGGVLEGGVYRNAKSEFRFKCANGHFSTRNWNMLQRGFFCEKDNCSEAKNKKVKLEEIRLAWKPKQFFHHPC